MSSTSNSNHACGTAVSAGHSPLPKHDSAAWVSGHTANVLTPLTPSVCRYSPSSTLNRMPSASSYSRRDSVTLEVIGPKPAMKSTFLSQLVSMGTGATYSVTVQVKNGGGATAGSTSAAGVTDAVIALTGASGLREHHKSN